MCEAKYLQRVLLSGLLILGPSVAVAQNANDVISLFRGLAQTAIVQSTLFEWQKLPNDQLACIDRALTGRGSSIQGVIQQGIQPTDQRVSDLKASCVSQPGPREAKGDRQSVYLVDGLLLGGRVQPDSSAYRQYQCSPSSQFSGFTWCKKKTEERSSRGQYSSSYSILHSQTGVALYVNRYLEPAWFSGNEATDDINRLSKKYGAPTRTIPMPRQSSVPNGMIVTWGNVMLEPLDPNNVGQLAIGHDVRGGFMVDHIGNFQRSAQQGLPIYRLTGGGGYVWAASWDQKGVGTLRFLTVDASAINAQISNGGAKVESGAVVDRKPIDQTPLTFTQDSSEKVRADALAAESIRLMEAQKAAAEGSNRKRIADPESVKLTAQARGFSDPMPLPNRAITVTPPAREDSASMPSLSSPRESNYEERPFDDLDRAVTPEQKLGAILKRNWAFSVNDCQAPLPYRARLDCAERKGFGFALSYPGECKITIVERQPMPFNVKRTWDGRIDGRYLQARETTIDLSTLKEDRISTSPLLELYFDISKSNMPVVRVSMSDAPEQWIVLPPPPLESDFATEFPDREVRSQALSRAIQLWSQKITSNGRLTIDRSSLDLSPQFFKVTTQSMGGLWYSDGGALGRAAQGRLIDILKSLLSKCHARSEASEVKPVKPVSSLIADSQDQQKVIRTGGNRIADVAESKARDQSTFWILVAGGMLCLGLIGGIAIARAGNRQFDSSSAESGQSGVLSFVVMIVAGMGIIVADHKVGPIFPDLLYCVVGAGTVIEQPGHTKASSWSANNGCEAYEPRCATRWNYTPPTSSCLHGTLWDAIEGKIQNIQRRG